MSKKQPVQKEPLITEEDKQNDPVIRTIFKKIRNTTKKIGDIQQIEGRADLKPEQVQKVKSKPSLVDDRRKFEQFAKFYKTIITENAAEAKGQVNPEFVNIAQLFVLSHFISVNPDSNAANTLNEAESKIVTGILKDVKSTETLAQRTDRLSETIKSYMENAALVNKVAQLMTDKTFGANTLQKTYASLQPVETKQPTKKQTLAPVPEPPVAPPPKAEPVKETTVEIPKPTKVQEKPQPVEVIHVHAPKEEKENIETVQAKPAESKVVSTHVEKSVEEPKEEPKTENVAADSGEGKHLRKAQNRGEYRPEKKYKLKEGGGNSDNKGYQNKGNFNNRPRGGYKGDGNRDRDLDRKREPVQEKNSPATSLQSSSEKRPEFNRQQKKELQDDGYIVVQSKKPVKYTKQRPKDTNETRDQYRKQHGYREKKE